MIKTIIKLAIAALVVHACWRSGNVFLKYYKFKDAVHEAVLFSNSKSDALLQSRSRMSLLIPEMPRRPDFL